MDELLELLNIVGLVDNPAECSSLSKQAVVDDSPYLLAGERILTLAKKKKRRAPVKSQTLTVRLCDLNYSHLCPEPKKAKEQLRTYIQGFIKRAFKEIDKKECTNIGDIPFLCHWEKLIPLHFFDVEIGDFEKRLAQEVSRSRTILTLRLNHTLFYLPVSPHRRFSNSSYYFKRNPEQTINIMHIEKAFSELFIMHWLNSLLIDAEFDSEIKAVLKELVKDYSKALYQYDWLLNGIPKWFKEFLEDSGYKKSEEMYYLTSSNASSSRKAVSFYNTENLEGFLRIIAYVYDGMLVKAEELICDSTSTPYLNPPYNLWDYAYETLRYFVKEIQNGREEQYFRKKLDGMAARAYTTKRNIPLYILQEMKSSKLNQYFGFIEYDAEVDLTLVNAIIEEFIKLNRIYFHGFKCKNIAMRFRKLGRHKALGLYYPSLNTMVVDFRSPSSFVHEYFHMLDDVLGGLSLKSDFFRIVDRYQLIMTESVKKEEAKGNQLFSKNSKYNLNYYLQNCEIFARCGEIHLFRNLHVVSSLLKHEDTHSFAYPEDNKLNELIDKYYSQLLEHLEDMKIAGGEQYEADLHIADY